MSLSVDSRYCGKVYVIRCVGRIVAGDETNILEPAINRGLLETNQLVLDVGDVTHIDSTGMGLLVRFLTRSKNRGGDLRLSAPQPFFRTLMQMTRLSSIFRTYDCEEEAIVSYIKEPRSTASEAAATGPVVLFLDESPDLCIFVRSLLNGYGYEVISTSRLYDAKLLLSASDAAYIVLGPDCSRLPCNEVVGSLKQLAPTATIIQLGRAFKLFDTEAATLELLQKMQIGKPASA